MLACLDGHSHMELLCALGTEAVAAIVALLIGWFLNGLRIKPKFKALEKKLAERQENAGARTVKAVEEVIESERT